MKYIIFLLLCLGCKRTENEIQEDNQRDYNAARQIISQDIFYIKDKETNLCFAAYNPYRKNSFFTNVPCTEVVESKLINK